MPFPKLSLIDRGLFKLKRFFNFKHYHNAQLFWPIVEKYFKVNEKRYDFAIAYNQGFSTYYTAKFLNADVKYAWLNIDYRKAGYLIDFDVSFYEKFKKVIAVSPEAKSGFIEVLENKNIIVDIIKDISDKKNIKERSEEEMQNKFEVGNSIKIVTVGRLAEQKGIPLAIDACKILNKKYDVKWYVIGEGVMRPKLENLINEKNLTGSFFLYGAYQNPYPYMKACDIYVQTSLFEGLGLTVIEASYLNKPIVSTNFPTVYGILKDGETGLIAEMNAEDIVKKIERLITDKALRETLVSNLEEQENTDKQVTLQQIDFLLNV